MFGGRGFGVKRLLLVISFTLDEFWLFDIKKRFWKFYFYDNKINEKFFVCFGCVVCSYKNKVVMFGFLSIFIFDMERKRWNVLFNDIVFLKSRS